MPSDFCLLYTSFQSVGSFSSIESLGSGTSDASSNALAGSVCSSSFSLPGLAEMNEPAVDPIELARVCAEALSPAFDYCPTTRKIAFAGSSPQEIAESKERAHAGSHFSCPDISSPITRSAAFDAFLGEASRVYENVRKTPNPGKNAEYIPALKWRDRHDFGISIVTPDGGQISMGDARVAFSLQSTSKPLDLLLALDSAGIDAVNSVVAEKYSPMPFNAPATVGSVLLAKQVDAECEIVDNKTGRQRVVGDLMDLKKPELTNELFESLTKAGDTRAINAMSNLGALATSSRISSCVTINDGSGRSFDLFGIGQIGNSLKLAKLLGRPTDGEPLVDIDFNVFASEITACSGNQVLARLNVLSDARLHNRRIDNVALDAFEAVDIYTNNWSLRTHIAGLASMFAPIANDGINPYTSAQVVPSEHAQIVIDQMKKGGLYEASREFYKDTGLIAKSGVGGAIVAVHPASGLTIGTYSAPLDSHGNSARGMDFLRQIAGSPQFKALVASMAQTKSQNRSIRISDRSIAEISAES